MRNITLMFHCIRCCSVDFVEAAGARHSSSELGSALLQRCSVAVLGKHFHTLKLLLYLYLYKYRVKF